MIILKTLKKCPNRNKYDTCISTCMFKMKGPYRDFSIYTQSFDRWVNKVPKSSFVRLYIDNSVLNDEKVLSYFDSKYNKLEIIHFEAKQFMNEDGIYHDGTFGSIVRLLPLYDKTLKARYIFSSDLDTPVWGFSNNYLTDLRKERVSVSYWSWAYYIRAWSGDVDLPVGIGHLIIDKRQFNFKIQDLYQYLKDVLNGKYDEIKSNILKIFEKRKRQLKDMKYFVYGFDELFVNLYMNPEFMKRKRIVYIDMNLLNLRWLLQNYENYTELQKYTANSYFKADIKNFNKMILLNEELYGDLISDKSIEHNFTFNKAIETYEKYKSKIKFYSYFPLGTKVIL